MFLGLCLCSICSSCRLSRCSRTCLFFSETSLGIRLMVVLLWSLLNPKEGIFELQVLYYVPRAKADGSGLFHYSILYRYKHCYKHCMDEFSGYPRLVMVTLIPNTDSRSMVHSIVVLSIITTTNNSSYPSHLMVQCYRVPDLNNQIPTNDAVIPVKGSNQ